MKRYSVVQLRGRLADVLDEAEAGHPVVIERRGVRYVLQVEPASKAGRRKRQPRIETLDDPASATWFGKAFDLSWTRDPFDRLIVAHARLRGWRLATGDEQLVAQLADGERLAR
jgi:PIN domain nuclease of toxin-antitoxin system